MQANHYNLRGMSHVIYQSLTNMMPELAHNSQIVDHRLLQELEDQLRQKLVLREDGTSRLVIDLLLTRAMLEVRRSLSQNNAQFVKIASLVSSKPFSPQLMG